MQQGVTSTSALVKVVDWFAEHVLGDLQAAPGAVHPILQVDAIRYLYTFRNQVRRNAHKGHDCCVTGGYSSQRSN